MISSINPASTTDPSALRGQAAIVTGAGRGIGRSIALALAAAGARVVLTARSADELDAVRHAIEEAGGEAVSVPADLAREPDIVSLPEAALELFGRLDILVNNAGFGHYGPMEESTTAQWEETLAVNARAPYQLCREAIPHLRKQEISFIVNIGSVVSVKGYSDQAIYTASKHALMGLSKSLAKEVQKDNIRVHVVCPGGVDTDLVARARPDLDRSTLMQPDEIADIVLFLVTRRGNAVIDEIHVRRSTSTPFA